jgi:hypothetical protein
MTAVQRESHGAASFVMRSMILRKITQLALIATLACAGEPELKELVSTAQAFLRAAESQDSSEHAFDSLAWERGKDLWKYNPEIAQAALDHMERRYLSFRGDTVLAEFDTGGGKENLKVKYIRKAGRWKVKFVSVTEPE